MRGIFSFFYRRFAGNILKIQEIQEFFGKYRRQNSGFQNTGDLQEIQEISLYNFSARIATDLLQALIIMLSGANRLAAYIAERAWSVHSVFFIKNLARALGYRFFGEVAFLG